MLFNFNLCTLENVEPTDIPLEKALTASAESVQTKDLVKNITSYKSFEAKWPEDERARNMIAKNNTLEVMGKNTNFLGLKTGNEISVAHKLQFSDEENNIRSSVLLTERFPSPKGPEYKSLSTPRPGSTTVALIDNPGVISEKEAFTIAAFVYSNFDPKRNSESSPHVMQNIAVEQMPEVANKQSNSEDARQITERNSKMVNAALQLLRTQ